MSAHWAWRVTCKECASVFPLGNCAAARRGLDARIINFGGFQTHRVPMDQNGQSILSRLEDFGSLARW